jgi:A/G-specific adenine glycosylase
MEHKPAAEAVRRRFPKALLKWNREANMRAMPWKGEKDPYKIWLSEIILQQTRVEQGRAYYERFVKTFPTVHDLAAAPEQQVFKLWEGLGYYTRCKNLIATARHISGELKGAFPHTYEDILGLKGIGPYTAAAIASFAYNLPHAVLDGNVFRVLSRIMDIELPVDSAEGKKYFQETANALLPPKEAGIYNQAMMDFGATICKPVPECAQCFFNRHCSAFLLHKQNALPVKQNKIRVKERWLNYFVLRHQKQIAIHQRTQKDIWQNLFEFLLVDTNEKPQVNELLTQLERNYGLAKGSYAIGKEAALSQRLSHQLIHFTFLTLELGSLHLFDNMQWVAEDQLEAYPFPKTLQSLLKRHRI